MSQLYDDLYYNHDPYYKHVQPAQSQIKGVASKSFYKVIRSNFADFSHYQIRVCHDRNRVKVKRIGMTSHLLLYKIV